MSAEIENLLSSLSRRAALIGGTAAMASRAWAQAKPGTVLITGASRGIGFGMAQQYAASGHQVIATARNPAAAGPLKQLAAKHKNVQLETLDVTKLDQIDALAAKLKGTAIDILVNNAGISGGGDNQDFGKINYAIFDEVFHTNVRGPLKMAEAFIEHVAASVQKKLISISSNEGSLGSISQRPDHRNFFYRASKSALNMVMVNASKAVKDKGVIVTLLSPGFVMSDFTAGMKLPMMITIEESARKCIEVMAKLTMADSGKFYRHTGDEAAW